MSEKGGCVGGCLKGFLITVVLTVVGIVLFAKFALPGLIADALLAGGNMGGTSETKMDIKLNQIDFALSVLDKVNDSNIKELFADVDKRGTKDGKEIIGMALDKFGLTNVDKTMVDQMAADFKYADYTNLVAGYNANPMAFNLAIGPFKGLAEDTLKELKKKKQAAER